MSCGHPAARDTRNVSLPQRVAEKVIVEPSQASGAATAGSGSTLLPLPGAATTLERSSHIALPCSAFSPVTLYRVTYLLPSATHALSPILGPRQGSLLRASSLSPDS